MKRSYPVFLCLCPLLLISAASASAQNTQALVETPLSVSESLKARTSAPPPRSGGAHGSHSPHARLTPEKHIQVALGHKAEGRLGEAFKSLNDAISLNPLSAELFAVRGSLYLEKNNVSLALRDFESALKIAPDSAAILTNRAQAYRHFGRIAEALKDLNKAIQLKPDLIAAYFNRGSIHYSSGDFTSALKDFDSCIAMEPHVAGPYFNRASTRNAMGDRQGAIDDLKRFVNITGNQQWKNTAQKLLDQWQSSVSLEKPEKVDS